jgi:hypothetical protein
MVVDNYSRECLAIKAGQSIKPKFGEIGLNVPRDRKSEFEPKDCQHV